MSNRRSGGDVVTIGDVHKPLRVLVLDQLREQIVSGQLAPGLRIVEDHIARELGVSRNPVREALRVLEAEGLVDMSPRRGAVVSALSPGDVEQVFEVREGLESFAARLAARKATPENTAVLFAELERAEGALKGKDAAGLTMHNTRFHSNVYALADNRYLAEVMDIIGGRMERIYRQSAVTRGPGSVEEHGAIVRAICSGDEDLAEQLAAQHVQNAAQTYRDKVAHQLAGGK
jgi:DNA-binding GntR family transcriptional regulator